VAKAGNEQETKPVQGLLCPGMEESPVADAMESCGKGVLKETAYKLNAFENADFVLAGFPIPGADMNVLLIDPEDSLIADDTAVNILAEVFDSIFAAACPIDRGIPIHLDQLPEQTRVDEALVVQLLGEEGPQAFGENTSVDEEA